MIDAIAMPEVLPNGGASAADRPRKEAELRARLERAERDEESLIERAMAEGLDVGRRSRADPWAALGIRLGQDAAQLAS